MTPSRRTGSCLLLAALLAVPGCTFFARYDSIAVLPPETGTPGFPADYGTWTLRWLADSGEVREQRIDDGLPAVITVARELPLIITAVPDPAEESGLWMPRPAGYVSGADEARGKNLRIEWLDGFAADMLLNLTEGGINPLAVNVERIRDTAAERSEGNPWNLDARRLAEDITAGDLWTYSFRLVETVDVLLSLPEGLWYSRYAPCIPIAVDDGGWNGSLIPGYHVFQRSEDRLVAAVWVDIQRPPVVFCSVSDY